MSVTALAERSGSYKATVDAEQALIELAKYGLPRVGMYGEGWHAHIEMNTTVKGGKFEIRSEFRMATPSEALRQLLDRVETATRK